MSSALMGWWIYHVDVRLIWIVWTFHVTFDAMASILKNVIQFTNLVIGMPTALPHGLNVNGVAVAPQLGGANGPGLTITADATNVTVTRSATGPASPSVYVEHWHSIEQVLPLPGKLAGLTPFFLSSGVGDAGESVFDNFVFRPGGVAGGNVYTDWAALVAAAALVQGYKTIQFDNSLAACNIPAGVYDMQFTEWTGFRRAGQAAAAVTIQDGASFTNLAKIGGELTVTNACVAVAPIVITGSPTTIFEIGTGPQGDIPFINNTGGAPFIDCSAMTGGTLVLRIHASIDGTAPAVQFGASPANMVLVAFDGSTVATGMIAGTGAGSLTLFLTNNAGLGRQDAYSGTITYGQASAFNAPGALGLSRSWMIPGSALQAAPVPTTVARTFATGLGMNTTIRYDTTAGDIAQTLPIVRSAAPAIGTNLTVEGALESTGLDVTIKNEIGANNVNVSPAAGETIDGGAGPIAVPAGGARIFRSDGVSNWIIVGGYL